VAIVLALTAGVAAPARAQTPRADHDAPADSAHRPPRDRWLAADKVEHALLAGFTYAGGFAIARIAGVDRRPALALAIVPTAVVSVGKEVHDRRGGGRFGVRDLVADVVGTLAYASLLARTAR
jgi:uncharacterized protein YfiM (DUF2279 family)